MAVTGPRCPNHRVKLVDCHNGIGICPISNCRFEYTADQAERITKLKIDAFGKVVESTDYKVRQVDGDGG